MFSPSLIPSLGRLQSLYPVKSQFPAVGFTYPISFIFIFILPLIVLILRKLFLNRGKNWEVPKWFRLQPALPTHLQTVSPPTHPRLIL